MSKVTEAVLGTGLVEDMTMQELGRWGAPVMTSSIPMSLPQDPEEAIGKIEESMQHPEMVTVRETDLEILQQYLTTQKEGTLSVESIKGDSASWGVTFGRTLLGEYIIPMFERVNEANPVLDVLADCVVNLHIGKEVIPLGSPRELYYGMYKVFTVWVRV